MASLENRKHELFAQAIAKGESASAAYVSAGYTKNDGNAIRLKGNEKVALRIAELQERAAIKAELGILDIVKMLREDRDLAHQIEQPGAAVSASLGIAKVLGLVKDKTELTGKDGEPLKFEQVQNDADAFTRAVVGLSARRGAGSGVGETQH